VIGARDAAQIEAAAGELGPARAVGVTAHNASAEALLPTRIAAGRVREIDARSGDPDEVRAKLSEQIPLRRYGTPEEFGRVAAFLLSPASYLTGTMIPVDGGALRAI
jgi:NAD(P)-dependent dehydrogenase (short-subunit alcohol dehydrogenase family)